MLDPISEASSEHEIDEAMLSAVGIRLHVNNEVAGDYSHAFRMLSESNSGALEVGGHHSRIQISVSGSDALGRRVKLYYERLNQLRQLHLTTSAHLR